MSANYYMPEFIQNVAFSSYSIIYVETLLDRILEEQKIKTEKKFKFVEVEQYKIEALKETIKAYREQLKTVKLYLNNYIKKLKEVEKKGELDSKMYSLTEDIKSKLFDLIQGTKFNESTLDKNWATSSTPKGEIYVYEDGPDQIRSEYKIYEKSHNGWQAKMITKIDIERYCKGKDKEKECKDEYFKNAKLKTNEKVVIFLSDNKNLDDSGIKNLGDNDYSFDIPTDYKMPLFPYFWTKNVVNDAREFLKEYREENVKEKVKNNDMMLWYKKNKLYNESKELFESINGLYQRIEITMTNILEEFPTYSKETKELINILQKSNFY